MPKSKTQSSTKKAPASPKATLVADPIGVLGAQIAKAMTKELMRLAGTAPPMRSKKATVGLFAGIEPKELEARLCEVAGKSLERALLSKTAKGKALRMSLIVALARTELAAERGVMP
jgi:hypothetical protein